MTKSLRLIIILAFSATSAHAGVLHWNTFEWASADLGNGHVVEKAAIMLPVQLDGIHHHRISMQFDTGVQNSYLYGVPYQALRAAKMPPIAPDRANRIYASGRLGGQRFRRWAFELLGDFGDAPQANDTTVIGTIGLDFFAGRILLLDFPRRRYTVANSIHDLPRRLHDSTRFVDMDARDGKIFVSAAVNGEKIDSLVFDTGSSLFPIWLGKKDWQRVVEVGETETGASRIRISAWGESIDCFGAPLKERMEIAGVIAEKAIAYFCDYEGKQQRDISEWPYKANGLVGNALFYDEYIVVLDIKGKRFGVARSSELDRHR